MDSVVRGILFGGSRPCWAGPFFDGDGGGGGGGSEGADGAEKGASPPDGKAGAGTATEVEKGEPGKKGEDGKPGENGEGAEKKPDGAEALNVDSFSLPEGYSFQDEDAKSFMEILSDGALSEKDRAQKFLELHCKVLGDYTAGLDASGKAADAADAKRAAEQEAEWLDACKADPEIGGHNWERSQAQLQRVLSELKLDKLHGMMVDMGMENHPDYLKPIVGLHRLIGEDRAGGGKASGERKSDRDVFYPSQENE